MNDVPRLAELRAAAAAHPHPLLFATVSGAHLYGFPSPDSDFDLRGSHILPPRDVLGLVIGAETVQTERNEPGFELDLVTHDVKKFFGLMLKKNGYVLEQLYSPLVVHSTPEFEELREIAKGCVTRFHAHHYFGFFDTQWKLFQKESPPRVKPLLYTYRVLLTGIHLMRTGIVEANLRHLNEEYGLSFIPELIERKVTGAEKSVLTGADMDFYTREVMKLRERLQAEFEQSALRDVPTASAALHDLLLRLRGAQ